MNKFSDIVRLQRVVATCLRFVHNLKTTQNERIYGPSKATELHRALFFLIGIIQKKHVAEEFDKSANGKTIKNKRIRSLNPFVDNKGIMRVGGRLTNAPISFD